MVSAALALMLAARAALQVPAPAPPRFPAGTRLIRLDVSVVDRPGRPVAGLRPEGVAVKEEGRGVDVAYYQAVEEPGTGGESSERPAAASPPNRIVILVDARTMSPAQLHRAREAVTGYLALARDGEWLRLSNLAT